MAVTINDTVMTSDKSAHTARHAPDRNGWEVSWPPGQILERNTAVTAMMLADTIGRDLHDRHRLWPRIQNRAGEPALTAPGALRRVSQPPQSATTRKDVPLERTGPEAAS